eukprot:g1538.t1
MDQTYIILRPNRFGSTERDILFRFGKFCYRDPATNLGVKVLTLDNFSLVLKVLQQRQGAMPFLCRDHDLHAFPQFKQPIDHARAVAEFVSEELLRNEDKLETLSEFGMTAWINDDFGAFYMELPASPAHLEELREVEMIVAKMFIGHVLFCVLYHDGKFLVTLSDAHGEHELLDTNFPNMQNPHKEFPLEKYEGAKDAAPPQAGDRLPGNLRYLSLTLKYSAHASIAAQKDPDFDEGEDDSDEDAAGDVEDLLDQADASGPGPHDGPVFKEGYHQTYIVRKPSGRTTKRSVFVRCGNWCYNGEVDLGQISLALADVPMAIPILQAQQGSLRYVSEFAQLPRTSMYRKVLLHLQRVAGFIEQQAATEATIRALMQLEGLARSPTKSKPAKQQPGVQMMVSDAPEEYFELELTENCKSYKNVELLASKTYVRGVIMVLIYFDGSVYCTLSEGEGSQPLLDVNFPDMSRKGGGCQIGTFEHPHFRKMSVWQGAPPVTGGTPSPKSKAKSRAKGGGSTLDFGDEGGASDGESPGRGSRSSRHATSSRGGADAVEVDGAGESSNGLTAQGQTYIIFHHPSKLPEGDDDIVEEVGGDIGPTRRKAFFIFGGWCYAGDINVDSDPGEMSLKSIPDILPTVAAQQQSMAFSTELESLHATSSSYKAIHRLQKAAQYLVKQLMGAGEELEKLRSLLEKRGQSPWIDDDSRGVYFELQMTEEGAEPLTCVEVAASKMYIGGALVSLMFFDGNLYACLADGEKGEQNLLDSAFPDVAHKARGYTLGSAPHSFYKKFSVWEGAPPPLEKVGGSARGQRAATRGDSSPATSEHGSSDFAGSKEEARAKDGDEREESDRSRMTGAKPPHRLAPLKAMGMGAKPPHRLAPIGGGSAAGGLKPLKSLSGAAPWDANGRPLTLDKKPLGSISKKK